MNSNTVVKNKLEVKPNWKVQIPGCEPVSSLTSVRLAQAFYCQNGGLIDVKVLLACIPGSKLVHVTTPIGHLGSGWFVELPSGPPPDENQCICGPDWYAMMKKCNQTEEVQKPTCEGFSTNWCNYDIDPYKQLKNPANRPNSLPLSPPLI
jgi:hypothetical protein